MNAFDFRELVSAWTHCAGLMLAMPGTLILWRRSDGQLGKRLSLLVYGLSLIFCYAASTLYHGVRLPADRLAAFVRLASVGIFALIAGSYTPLAWNLMQGRWRVWTLMAVSVVPRSPWRSATSQAHILHPFRYR
jgi:hemolysin III